MLIFLIGYMGCGKSTIGKWLSKRFDLNFIDMDSVIEAQQGCSIGEIFAQQGEEAFRLIERQAIKDVASKQQNTIIATGGGAPCFHDNMETMNSLGCTVYLHNSPEQLASHLEHGKAKRPIIKDLSQEELTDFIRSALEKREMFYNQAQLVVDCCGSTNEYIAEHIKSYIDFCKKI